MPLHSPSRSTIVDAPTAAPARARSRPAWLRVIAGPPSPQSDAVVRLLYLWPSYLFIAGLMGAAVSMDLAPSLETYVVYAYGVTGVACFYGVLRAGMTRRWRDPMMVFPQVCFNLTVVVLAYVLVPLTRGLVVQWLCLLILFDMRRLGGRQVLVAAALAYGLLILAMTGIQYSRPDNIDLGAEAVNIGMAALTLCALLAVTRVGRRVDEQRRAQQTKLAETVAKLDELAIRDALTGAFNRRHTQVLLDRELRRYRRSQRPLSVALLDIDHFKRVNDEHGHAVGDAVLRDVASLLATVLKPPNVVGRWGGEEFLVLMPERTQEEACLTLQTAAQALGQHDWHQHAPGLSVSFSGGVTQYRSADKLKARVEDESSTLLERADGALYGAKHAGRDRIHIA